MRQKILFIVLMYSRAVFAGVLEERRYAESIQNIIEPFVVEGELGEHFEGDMLLTEEQKMALSSPEFNRNGLIDTTKRWPENTFVYVITANEFDDNQRNSITGAMEEIANNSCIKFRQRENDEYAVRITSARSGCYSNVGYIYDENNPRDDQVLNLGRGCYSRGTIVHEMLHALGFHHMQSTYNRDDYVRIAWENIQRGRESNFQKYDNNTVTDFGVLYDYGSVMHYSSRAFSKNGRRTIVPLQQGVTIGQRVGMSQSDIKKLNKMYCDTGDAEVVDSICSHT